MPRQKAKDKRQKDTKGARTYSTAISEHKRGKKKAKYCNVRKFYIHWQKNQFSLGKCKR